MEETIEQLVSELVNSRSEHKKLLSQLRDNRQERSRLQREINRLENAERIAYFNKLYDPDNGGGK